MGNAWRTIAAALRWPTSPIGGEGGGGSGGGGGGKGRRRSWCTNTAYWTPPPSPPPTSAQSQGDNTHDLDIHFLQLMLIGEIGFD